MKSIDWKKVSSDKDLSPQYAVNVFNRFQELSSSSHLGSDNIDSIYNNLIVANEEVALSTLPKKSNRAKIRSVQTRVSHQLEKGKLLLITTRIHLALTRSN